MERARAALEARIKAQADSLDGGLHAASIFLEEMLALLGPTTGLEGEQTENLQTLRRGYELIHAGILHIDPEVQKPYIEQLRVLFQQLGDIERMVDLTMPPAATTRVSKRFDGTYQIPIARRGRNSFRW